MWLPMKPPAGDPHLKHAGIEREQRRPSHIMPDAARAAKEIAVFPAFAMHIFNDDPVLNGSALALQGMGNIA